MFLGHRLNPNWKGYCIWAFKTTNCNINCNVCIWLQENFHNNILRYYIELKPNHINTLNFFAKPLTWPLTNIMPLYYKLIHLLSAQLFLWFYGVNYVKYLEVFTRPFWAGLRVWLWSIVPLVGETRLAQPTGWPDRQTDTGMSLDSTPSPMPGVARQTPQWNAWGQKRARDKSEGAGQRLKISQSNFTRCLSNTFAYWFL